MYINKTKEKKSQVHLGIIVLIFALVFGIYLYSKSHLLPFFWITGLAFGFVLQRSKFCFAAALRDPYLIGSTSLSKALLTSLALTSIGFTAIIYGYHISGLEISLDKVIVNISPALILGASSLNRHGFSWRLCSRSTYEDGRRFSNPVCSLNFLYYRLLMGCP